MPLSGTLAEFSVEHILRLLELSAHTGVLQVKSDGAKASLEVTDGALTAARRGDEEGEVALGEILATRAGSFVFEPGPTGDPNLEGELDEVLERARAAAEQLAAIRADIPSDRVRFTLSERATSGGSFTLTSDELRVLLAVDGRRDVAALAAHCRYARPKALQHLHRLLREGLLEVAGETAAPLAIETVGPAAAAVGEERPRAKPKRRRAAAATAAPRPEAKEAQVAAATAAPAAAEEPAPSEELAAELDLRLAALAQPVAPEVVEAPQATAREEAVGAPAEATPAETAASGEERILVAPTQQPAAERVGSTERTVIFELHYLPPTVAPPELEIEKPAAPETPKRGLFGFLRLRFATKTAEPGQRTELDVPSPPQLAALANELFREYERVGVAQVELAGGGRGGFEESIPARLQRIYVNHPIGRRLPLRDDLVDVVALRQDDYPPAQVLPYLALLVRELRDSAARAWGADHARAIYQGVVGRIFGGAPVPTPTQILERAATPLRARLTIRTGGTGGPFELGPRAYVIGRSSACDVVLRDPSVSGRHARLTPLLEGFQVADLGSTNGTTVNGERLTGERLLRGGEVLRLGDATLLYERLADEGS